MSYRVEMLDSFGRWQHLSLRDGWAVFADFHSAVLCRAHQVGRGWDPDRLRIMKNGPVDNLQKIDRRSLR